MPASHSWAVLPCSEGECTKPDVMYLVSNAGACVHTVCACVDLSRVRPAVHKGL